MNKKILIALFLLSISHSNFALAQFDDSDSTTEECVGDECGGTEDTTATESTVESSEEEDF